MTNVIFQPAGNAGGREHYVDTIANPVPLERLARHLPAEVIEELRRTATGGSIPVWGVTPGANGNNERKWKRIAPGDWALFLQNGRAVSAGRVSAKVHSPELAKDLWRVQEDGQTWEFVYFLERVTPVNISYAELNAAAGYDAANRFQGFTVLDSPRTDSVVALIDSTAVARTASGAAWLVRQTSSSQYRNVDGEEYEYPPGIPNGRQIRKGDVFVLYRNQVEAADRPIFGVGRISRIDQRGEKLVAVYDRYLEVNPQLSWSDIGGDPRNNPRNSFNSMHKQAFDGLLQRLGLSSVEELPVGVQRFVRKDAELTTQITEEKGQWRRGMSMDDLVGITHWTRVELDELCDLIRTRAPQVILAGPPGTSKTWVARHVCKYLTQGDGQHFKIVQFHPSYSYEEFIEGLRPEANPDGVIVFQPVAGILLRMLKEAGSDPGPHVLLIDEMNRANLPKVLGELMFLFEYRDEKIDLRYQRDFSLPSSMRFVGTMNTADRSIRSIDSALRRRFAIVECPPRQDVLERYYSVYDNQVPNLLDGFEKLNQELTTKLDRHHTVGHAFFMDSHMTRDRLRETWRYKVSPLLEEYFFDQPDVSASFSMDQFWPE